MSKSKIIMSLLVLILITSCATNKTVEQEDEFATDATEATSTNDVASKSSADDLSTSGSSETSKSGGTEQNTSKADDSEFSLNEPVSNTAESGKSKDEFAEFTDSSSAASSTDSPKNTSEANPSAELSKTDGELSLDGAADSATAIENELNNAAKEEGAVVAQNPKESSTDPLSESALNSADAPLSLDEPALKQTEAFQPSADAAIPAPTDVPVAPTAEAQLNASAPMGVTSESTVAESQSNSEVAQITAVQYKSNLNGGAVSISADRPLQFSTRINSATNQMIIEVQNSTVPNQLKRSLNTKDMSSSIGSVDIYQKPNSKISRFVVQLRAGSPEPLVQPEGNSLLIIGAANPSSSQMAKHSNQNQTLQAEENSLHPVSQNTDLMERPNQEQNSMSQVQNDVGFSSTNSSNQQSNENFASVQNNSPDNNLSEGKGILATQSFEEFLISNNKFYGKKISIETNNLDVKEAIKFIAEESGANIIMDDGLEGKISLKLKQVPWDQALVLILKAKKLGYLRQGNVLRIAKVADIQSEEVEAIKLLESRRNNEPLVVKRFFISYADIKELEQKIKEFIASTVSVVPGSVAEIGVTAPSSAGGANSPGAPAGATAATLPAPAPRGKVISDSRTSSLIVTDTPSNLTKIEKLIQALDSQPKQVLIEGKVIEATEEFSRSIGVNWSSNTATTNTINKAGVSITQGLPTSGVLDTNFSWGRVDVFGDLTARLMLGERQDKVRTLSSPKITVLSNQPANISQAVSVQIPSGSTVTQTPSGPVTSNQINTVPLGVFLKVTPQASNEGTVTLDLDIEKSTLVAVDSTQTNKRNAKSKLIVKSGQTAVIGGIFEATNSFGNSGVPGLKDIPILGALFKGQVERNQKSELIIFVTPHILQPVVGDEKQTSSVIN